MNYEIEIIKIVNEYIGQLSNYEVDSIINLAKHREWGVALENLCTQIDEYRLSVSADSYQKIEQMVNEMSLNDVDLDVLRKLIKE